MIFNRGFVRVAAATPVVRVADCGYNAEEILKLIIQAKENNVALVTFPELSITSVSCGDLYQNELLLSKAEEALAWLLNETKDIPLIWIVGLPFYSDSNLLNLAVVCYEGKILGACPKEGVELDRPFTQVLSSLSDEVELCNQLVHLSSNIIYHTTHFSFSVCFDTATHEVAPKADITCCLSGIPSFVGTHCSKIKLVQAKSIMNTSAYVYASPGFGESTTDYVYGGNAFVIDNGELISCSEKFQLTDSLIWGDLDIAHLHVKQRQNNQCRSKGLSVSIDFIEPQHSQCSRILNKHPFLSSEKEKNENYAEAYLIQTMGLAQRLLHTHTQKVVIGVSGGLDSTLALLVCLKAFDKMGLSRKNIIGITMPGFGTSDRTYRNAQLLMDKMGITVREISIKEACIGHFRDIDYDINKQDVTYENGQARERTQILMDVANMENAMVIGTGDLSELALGWATYNGDHMSMYAVNGSIPKTLVQDLVLWVAQNAVDKEVSETLLDILATPISPELKPVSEKGDIKQKTEDLVGPYELHDFFLYHTLKHGYTPALIYERAQMAFSETYTKEVIKHWLKIFFRRFFMQQFKRSCLPDGPNVTGLSLSPRGGWKMASDVTARIWLEAIEQLD